MAHTAYRTELRRRWRSLRSEHTIVVNEAEKMLSEVEGGKLSPIQGEAMLRILFDLLARRRELQDRLVEAGIFPKKKNARLRPRI